MSWMTDDRTANDPVYDLKNLLQSGVAIPTPGVNDPLTAVSYTHLTLPTILLV